MMHDTEQGIPNTTPGQEAKAGNDTTPTDRDKSELRLLWTCISLSLLLLLTCFIAIGAAVVSLFYWIIPYEAVYWCYFVAQTVSLVAAFGLTVRFWNKHYMTTCIKVLGTLPFTVIALVTISLVIRYYVIRNPFWEDDESCQVGAYCWRCEPIERCMAYFNSTNATEDAFSWLDGCSVRDVFPVESCYLGGNDDGVFEIENCNFTQICSVALDNA